MKEKRLNIGSVVLLKDATKKMMIIGFDVNYKNEKYDYVGCLFPEGIGKLNIKLVFNHTQIAEVVLKGYEGESIDSNNEIDNSIDLPKAIEVLKVDEENVYNINNFQI